MSKLIPTYQLQAFANRDHGSPGVYFPDYSAAKPAIPLHRPYRGDYYKISLCLRGIARLNANLETYVVTPGCLILATPDVVKQWLHVSADYETLTIFFTKDFITTTNEATGKLRFFLTLTTYVFQLSSLEATTIEASFRFLEQKYNTSTNQRDNVVRNIINSLLYEINALYDQRSVTTPANKTRSQLLTAAFRRLVQTHGSSARSVQFYAAMLCITPKHLTELVKEATGRTASSWITETVLVEAKTLLQNNTLTICEVASSLHFADQFAFSRFFKKGTGMSPTAYRQSG